MQFTYVQGGTVPPAQAITIACVDAETHTTPMDPLGVTLSDTATWLRLTPTTGQTPYDVDVSVVPAGLAPGSYNASIQIASTAEAIVNPEETMAVGLTIYAPPIAEIPPPAIGTISNLTIASGKAYKQFLMATGAVLYIDRNNYTFGTVPAVLDKHTAIRTANDDKGTSGTAPLITFKVNQDSTVYVLYTKVNTNIETAWLTPGNGWVADSFTVPSNLAGAEANRLVKHKGFSKDATVTLNGNAGTTNQTSMYHVVIVPTVAAGPTISFKTANNTTFATNHLDVEVNVSDGVTDVELLIDADTAPVAIQSARAHSKLPLIVSLQWMEDSIPVGTYQLKATAHNAAGAKASAQITVKRTASKKGSK